MATTRHEQADGSFLLIDPPAPYYTGPKVVRDENSAKRLEPIIQEAGFDPQDSEFENCRNRGR